LIAIAKESIAKLKIVLFILPFQELSKIHTELIKNELNKWDLEIKEIRQVYKLANKIIEKHN
jgi:hypothetical protein